MQSCRQPAICVSNSAALVETLAESELFGYVRGAFTGAAQDRAGLFEHADGGTLFLDEIGEMPINIQAKLLRVLQEQQVQRVGSAQGRRINVHIVAATNRDLQQGTQNGTFRSDLFFRLSIVEIALPRLSQRGGFGPAAEMLCAKISQALCQGAGWNLPRPQKLLAEYSWPGHVRELEHVIGCAAMMTEDTFIDIQHLPDIQRPAEPQPQSEPVFLSFEQLHRHHA